MICSGWENLKISLRSEVLSPLTREPTESRPPRPPGLPHSQKASRPPRSLGLQASKVFRPPGLQGLWPTCLPGLQTSRPPDLQATKASRHPRPPRPPGIPFLGLQVSRSPGIQASKASSPPGLQSLQLVPCPDLQSLQDTAQNYTIHYPKNIAHSTQLYLTDDFHPVSCQPCSKFKFKLRLPKYHRCIL
jgi:hypothetical protein